MWAIVGQYTDKMTQKCVKMSLFVRVVTHYGSNESNDSLGVFSVFLKFCSDVYKSHFFTVFTQLKFTKRPNPNESVFNYITKAYHRTMIQGEFYNVLSDIMI